LPEGNTGQFGVDNEGTNWMNKAEQLEQHDRAYADFVAVVRELTPEQFLRGGKSWAARDIVAHLIGWNGNIRIGCDQIREGKTPFYHADAPNDYRNFNAEFMKRHDSTDRDVLLAKLADASQVLRDYLGGVDEQDWARDFGPQHYRGGPATIGRCAESITREYIDHGKEIASGMG
jgi:DinB superfamily